MRPFATGRTVLYDPVKRTDVTIGHIGYWLHGSYLEPDRIGSAEEWARAAARHDFVVSPADLGGSLTPRNRRFHLYRPAGLAAAWASLAAREPDARSAFEVRLDGRALIYTRDECSQDEVWPALFVQAVPLDANDLPPDRRAAGFEDRAYFPGYHGLRFGGRCAARIGLPDYPLAGLRTGQRQGGLPPIWEVSLPVEDASFPRGASTWREDATASEPALRGPFGVYRDGRTLTYVREDCAPADTEDRFFVHVHDSGGAREALDFWFHDRGVRFGGVCMASVDLPGYEVRSVRTGQYDATGHLWDEEFALDAEEWLARFEAAAASEPALRAGGIRPARRGPRADVRARGLRRGGHRGPLLRARLRSRWRRAREPRLLVPRARAAPRRPLHGDGRVAGARRRARRRGAARRIGTPLGGRSRRRRGLAVARPPRRCGLGPIPSGRPLPRSLAPASARRSGSSRTRAQIDFDMHGDDLVSEGR